MSNIGLVIVTGIRNTVRQKVSLIIMVSVTIICVAGVALILCLLTIEPEVESAVPDRTVLEGHLSLILYSTSLLTIGITLNSFIFQTMVREKSRGILNALLATPLKLRDIWIGKSLALFVLGLVLAVVLTALTLVIVNVIYFVPEIGFLFTPAMIVNSLVAVPLIYLSFGLLAHLVGFIIKPATGNIIAQVFLPVMANLGIQLAVRNMMDASSWQFMVLNFGIALVIGVIILGIKPKLVPERVVLSG
ncbi:MAG: hypothetical protein ACLFVA_02830 [Dehalococcoidia bacterium]